MNVSMYNNCLTKMTHKSKKDAQKNIEHDNNKKKKKKIVRFYSAIQADTLTIIINN